MLPTLLLMTCVRPAKIMHWAVAGWAILLVGNNVIQHAIPKATYPLARYEEEISATFGKKYLFVHFSTWPRWHDLTQLKLPNIPHWPMDEKLLNDGNTQAVFQSSYERIDDALKQGGRVIIFGMLDKRDWDASWSLFPSKGISKNRLAKFFADRYRVVPIGELARIKAWELKPL